MVWVLRRNLKVRLLQCQFEVLLRKGLAGLVAGTGVLRLRTRAARPHGLRAAAHARRRARPDGLMGMLAG